MALELFKLVGSIYVDNDKANESISKTDEKATGLSNKFLAGIGTAAKWAAGIAVGAAAGATALYGMATKAAETTDRIDKMSQKIGISKTGFQEWDYVLGQNGMDIEKMQVGMKSLTSAMDSANSGSKSAAENFEKLGLSWNNADGSLKGQEEMMNESIMALAGMENGTEKARMATELFGKAGIEMMPMLNGGAEGIAELKNRASELGLVLSDETVTAGVVLGDTIDDVKKSFSMIGTVVGTEVMPVIQTLLDWVLENMPAIQSVLSTVFEYIKIVVSEVGNILIGLIDVIKSVVEQAQTEGTLFNDIWKACQVIFETVFNAIKDVFAIFKAAFNGDWEGFWNGIKQLFSDIWDGIKELLKIALDAIPKILQGAWTIVKDAAKALFNMIKEGFAEIWQNIVTWFGEKVTGLKTSITDKVNDFKDAGRQIFTAVWDGIKGVWTGIKNWMDEKVNWLSNKLAFWRSGSDEMNSSVNGSHAGGLDSVPYDGYIARLHKNERVLTADENTSLTSMVEALASALAMNSSNNSSSSQPIILQVNLDSRTVAQQLYEPLKTVSKQKGDAVIA